MVVNAGVAMFVAICVRAGSGPASKIELSPAEFRPCLSAPSSSTTSSRARFRSSRNFETVCEADTGEEIHYFGNGPVYGRSASDSSRWIYTDL